MNIAKLLGNNVHPTFVSGASAPQMYHPRVGRVTRVYLSVSDRAEYETGHSLFPGTPHQSDPRWDQQHSPFWDGYHDAEQEQQDRDDAKAERHAERMSRDR
jgi:hypothetical protein